MKVKIERTDWELSEEESDGTVVFSKEGKQYQAFSIYCDYQAGEIMDVEFDFIEDNDDSTWEKCFDKNKLKTKELISTGKWSYDGYGQIISINPIVADFGVICLELGHWSHDERIVGEYVFLKILRLDIALQN